MEVAVCWRGSACCMNTAWTAVALRSKFHRRLNPYFINALQYYHLQFIWHALKRLFNVFWTNFLKTNLVTDFYSYMILGFILPVVWPFYEQLLPICRFCEILSVRHKLQISHYRNVWDRGLPNPVYTQCVVMVMIRLHIALPILSSNHSLGTATVVRVNGGFHIRIIFLSYVLQKYYFKPNVSFF